MCKASFSFYLKLKLQFFQFKLKKWENNRLSKSSLFSLLSFLPLAAPGLFLKTVGSDSSSSFFLAHIFFNYEGSDSNDGTSKFPFARISKAVSSSQNGDTIFVLEGILEGYSELITKEINFRGASPSGSVVTCSTKNISRSKTALNFGRGGSISNLTITNCQVGGDLFSLFNKILET